MELLVRFIARSPLCLSTNRGVGNVTTTNDYIPGSTFRGTLAASYLRAGGSAKDEYFQRFFLSDGVSFPNLYPETVGEGRPVPLSARSCKRYPGFGPGADEHGVFDYLPSLAGAGTEEAVCPVCRAPFDRIGGYYESLADGNLQGVKVRRRLLERVGINRWTGTAEDGFLYSLEVIEEGQMFGGRIVVGDEAAEKLRQLLGELSADLYIGAARTRGLGKVELVKLEQVPRRTSPGWHEFNTLCQKVLPAEDVFYFSLTLTSDVILEDDFFRYKTVIEAKDLKAFGLDPACLRPVAQIAEPVWITGWNTAAGWPKEEEIGIKRGSVFLFAYTGELESLISALQRLEEQGLGRRRQEGFGRVSVADPFHWKARR